MVVQNRNIFVQGVFLFPGRSFHFAERATYHHFYTFAPKAARSATAVHRGISASEYDYFIANFGSMFKGHAGQPFYPDVDIGFAFLATRKLQVTPLWRTRAYKYRIVTLIQYLAQAGNIRFEMGVNAHVQYIIYLFVEH